ncbi:Rieske (2Fe-2S) protein [Halorubrum laminariae]|uniref:Rieske (2Fe-2S) protein n=1 Tax=Halorubrum laminariae TaxID=1433523 RepID=A0ABD6BXF2_9EURY|nr:Rieske 2Fe-2S domain-containing protein [Halorubrum laminariae]
MTGTKIVDLAAVPERGSYLFTAEDAVTNETEVILVRCADEPGVRAWVNVCPHETQRLDRGDGAAMRDGEIVCPKHGSMFDACTGDCDNGEAAGTSLPAVAVGVDDGGVYLTDDDYDYVRDGPADGDDGPADGDDGPGSTSHIGF